MNAGQPRQPIVVLISGRGSNMRTLIERSRDSSAAYAVRRVISDQSNAGGLLLAHQLGIDAQALPAAQHADRATYESTLAHSIAECAPALVVLAGFMRILSAEFVQRFAGKILNIHPSLLPKYPGLHTHRRVLAAREHEHGVTVHFVTEELDGGPPVIQARVPIVPSDDEVSLAARVQAKEHLIYPLAVQWFCDGRLKCEGRRVWLDGQSLREPVQYADSIDGGNA